MAFADFTITAEGAEWLAAAVEDAAQQTQTARLDSINFGRLGLGMSMSIWKACTDSLRVASSGQSVTISGIVSNEGDTTAHQLNRIEVWGRVIGVDEEPQLMAWSQSDQTETIPPATEQLITRRAVIQIALSGEAVVSISGAMSGYASEDDILLTAPHHTRGDIILSNSADTAVVRLAAESEDAPDLAKLVVGGTGITTGGDITCRKLYADGADAMVTPQGYSGIGGSLSVQGALEVGDGLAVSGDVRMDNSDLYVDGAITGDTLTITGATALGNTTVQSLTSTAVVSAPRGNFGSVATIRLSNPDNQVWSVTLGNGSVAINRGTRSAAASWLLSHVGNGLLFIGGANPLWVSSPLPSGRDAKCLYVLPGMTATQVESVMGDLPDRYDAVGFALP